MTLRLGTRASALAMAQARGVADALTRATGRPVELVPVTTEGDRSDAPVERLGVGVFVSALRDALADKEIDLAVHSYKDLPTAPVDGLVVAAVPARVDPGDALVARDGLTLAQLPPGARVGTGSPRRAAQLRAHRPDLAVVGLRGNVDTRLRKVATGELDAVVVACAGLVRLGRTDEITERLDPSVMLPAPAQGALAVECREDDGDTAAAVAVLDHPDSRVAVAAERQLLATLEAGCSAPVAGLAEVRSGPQGRIVTLHGAVISPDGSRMLRRSRTAPVPDGPETVAAAAQLGRDLAVDLFAAGARTILESDT
ncbi:MAG: hydroxymethylbilane synthase [Micromonosporaceae bacterium]